MGGARSEPTYAARIRLEGQLRRLGTDARTARVAEGMSQLAVARRARVSQASVSRVESGNLQISVAIVAGVFSALGMDLSVRAFPGPGVRLRDSGQIALTRVIQASAHADWRPILEAPVGGERGQAADVLLLSPASAEQTLWVGSPRRRSRHVNDNAIGHPVVRPVIHL
ncbi:MAG: helix-turn-helix domain-containing protein [Candidatus Limnocylindria bacterium]